MAERRETRPRSFREKFRRVPERRTEDHLWTISVEEIEAIEHLLLSTFLHHGPGLRWLSAEKRGRQVSEPRAEEPRVLGPGPRAEDHLWTISVEEIEAIEHPLLSTFPHHGPRVRWLSVEIRAEQVSAKSSAEYPSAGPKIIFGPFQSET